MTEIDETLRDKDKIVLQAVQEGNDDIQKITSQTTLKNHEVNYCFTKLEDCDLITIEKPDGYTTRNINGQKRVFQTPKQAALTDKGKQYLQQSEKQDIEQYENLTRRELVQKVHQLDNRVRSLEQSFETFRKQAMRKLE